MLIDTHCHLELKDFSHPAVADAPEGALVDERPEVLVRARAAGVERFICIGSGRSFEEVQTALDQAARHADVWAAIGIHPHDAASVTPLLLEQIEQAARVNSRVVAVGEIGLDYYYDHSDRETQRRVFRDFLQMARRLGKPVSLHLREAKERSSGDAHLEAQELLEEERVGDVGGVVHCFTGTLADAQRYVALGLHVSFSGVVTFKSAGAIREAARWVPAGRLLVETDCPYMAPVPLRGKRNEPAYVTHTARFLAELRGVSLEWFAEETSSNACRLFGLPPAGAPLPLSDGQRPANGALQPLN